MEARLDKMQQNAGAPVIVFIVCAKSQTHKPILIEICKSEPKWDPTMIKKRFKSLALTLAILASGPVSADRDYDVCMDAAMNNLSFSKCGGAFLKRADKELNEVWATVYSTLQGQTKQDLLAEQRAWNIYKELSCEFYANGEQGREGTTIHFAICRAQVIETRTKELRLYGKQL
jgi:uncharacterized protein YecT (DUF1311 family)